MRDAEGAECWFPEHGKSPRSLGYAVGHNLCWLLDLVLPTVNILQEKTSFLSAPWVL